ncbi:MAG: hypothetical protein KY475_04100 [Planctomycetes bacterium]|nr:hypothetical protein [Planctomycetota bacterium]
MAKLLHKGDETRRRWNIIAAGHARDSSYVPQLLARLDSDETHSNKRHIVRALGNIRDIRAEEHNAVPPDHPPTRSAQQRSFSVLGAIMLEVVTFALALFGFSAGFFAHGRIAKLEKRVADLESSQLSNKTVD